MTSNTQGVESLRNPSVSARVARLVFDSGLARVERPADMVAFIREHVYKPEYSVGAIGASKAASR